jgi:ubiquinone/menaquinone biosynthesis C-methylase UbiE
MAEPVGAARLQQIYDRTAAFYDHVAAEHQASAKLLAIELLARRPGERFLEVGVGTAWAFSRIVAATGAEQALGLDFSPGMLEVARHRLRTQGIEAGLVLGDARDLPVASGSIDCLLSTYTLEVLPESEIAAVLRECYRVLAPAGLIAIVNLTEGEDATDAAITDAWKRGYEADPEYYSGSRPLLLAPVLESLGFRGVSRTYSGNGAGWPSEVLLARR